MRTRERLRGLEQENLMLRWQRDNAIGTAVQLTDDFGKTHLTRTRSGPWMTCGTAVILIEGRAGGYRLDRLKPINEGSAG